MNSDLVVMTFDDREMAWTVYRSLQAMRKSQVLGLGDAVVVTRDSAGRVALHPEAADSLGLAGLLARLLFRPPNDIPPAVEAAGLDDGFVSAVVPALQSGGSALLFFIDSNSLSDPKDLLEILSLFRGKIHQTTLSPQNEALLRGMR